MFKTIAQYCLYGALLSVLIVATGTFFPFIGGKYYFFRTCVGLAGIATVLWWGFEAPAGEFKKRFDAIKRHPVFLGLSLFVAAFCLAAILADNPHGAIWSNFERGEGAFQMVHYYAWFFLAALLFDTLEKWRMALWVSLAAGVGMILYGVLAAAGQPGFIGPYGADKFNLIKELFGPGNRFQGSLGNPAYVAPYLMFVMAYAGWLLGEAKNIWTKIAYGTLIAFFFLFFILSQTKGAFVGLIAGVAVGGLFAALKIKKARLPLLGFLGACILIYGGLYSIRGTIADKKIPGARLLDINIGADSLQTRIWTWGSAWAGFKEYPFFGWGPENFSAAFDKHFDPRHFNPNQTTETWFDRAHNILLDYLSTTGIIGTLSYLGFLGTLAWSVIRNMKQHHVAQPLLLGLMSAYFVQALALFDVLPIYINLIMVSGLVLFYSKTTMVVHRVKSNQ